MDSHPSRLFDIFQLLKAPMFGSKPVVNIDSIIVSSLFGQQAKKKKKRSHHMHTIALECVVDDKTRSQIYSTFENGKDNLRFSNPMLYHDTTNKMAASIYRASDVLKRQGAESKALIEWCIAAYSMVINPESSIKLSCIKMGSADTLGFAIHAVRAIKTGQALYELIGLMPRDNKTKNSLVSTIKPNSSQNQSPRVERILFGPLRFMNHICGTPNIEFIATSNTSAFYAAATRDIAPGEELLVDYGKEWFANEPDGCPCVACKPEQHNEKRQCMEKDAETVEAEKKEARKVKNKRTRIRKKESRDAEI